MRNLSFSFLILASACMPAPVKAVDGWLDAYAQRDAARMLELTRPADRTLLAKALGDGADPTLAYALPERPLSHEILEISAKEEDRQIIEVKLTLHNPLATTSEKVGQKLGLPETRPMRRHFLVVNEEGSWGVKLDLARVVERAGLSESLLGLIAEGRLDEAEAKLKAGIPAKPDDGNGKPGEDRMLEELERRIREARARRGTRTSTTP